MKKKVIRLKQINFLELAKQPFTYNIFKNRYIWYGFLMGLFIPSICLLSNFASSIENNRWAGIAYNNCFSMPLHWLYFIVPFIFAFLLGSFGTFKTKIEAEAEAEAEAYKMLYRIKTNRW